MSDDTGVQFDDFSSEGSSTSAEPSAASPSGGSLNLILANEKSKYSASGNEVVDWLRGLTKIDPGSYGDDPYGAKGAFGDLGKPTVELDLNNPSLDLAKWQLQLIEAGLIGQRTKIHPGLADDATVSATSEVFRFMKRYSLTDPYDALRRLMQAGIVGGGGRGGGGGGEHKATQAEISQQEYLSQLRSAYLETWGVAAPPGYIERAAAAHVNIYEFMAHERAKPGYTSSPNYQKATQQLDSALAQRFGYAK